MRFSMDYENIESTNIFPSQAGIIAQIFPPLGDKLCIPLRADWLVTFEGFT